MNRESPWAWDRMVRLYNACGEQLTEACEAAIVARTTVPLAQEGEMPLTAPSSPARPLPRKEG